MLEPGKPVKGVRQVGILAGNAKDSKIFNCQVKGDVEGTGAYYKLYHFYYYGLQRPVLLLL